MGQRLEDGMEVPQKIKNGITTWSIPLIHPEELNTGSQRGIFTSTFTAVLLTIAEVWKPPKGSWIEVHNVGYLHNGMSLSINKEGDPDTYYNMEEP